MLVSAGPKGGVVLGLPGVTLLRSGDRFTQLATLYIPDQPEALEQTLADALGVAVGAVASLNWGDLRGALAASGIEPLPAQRLDRKDGNAGQVAQAVAAAMGKSGVNAAAPVFEGVSLAGDADGFRTAVAVALRAAQVTGWAGEAVTGTLVDGSDFTYLEPDIKRARSVLAGTGAGG